MPQDPANFLTLSQAVDALASDFGQYGPQSAMFRKIGPLILGKDFKTGMSSGRRTNWIRRMEGCPHEPVDETALGFYLIHMLETRNINAKDMAKICTLVFETPVRPGKFKGESGVWVEGQEAGFVCRRCGGCCRRLANTCTPEDYCLWKSLGRDDILAWVKQEVLGHGKIQYRIWVDPRTGKSAESCPFLVGQPGSDLFSCTIQDVKPLICREYPFTQKHARLTGCPGFTPGTG
ncbi:YkgJ family cysteine cluster protein [Desulfospira joergensenii]|uniref:YkgJ family cysteine cluster protein n=1 Tax=Desulfospira joergensenii TaxID=53329 RepID=UPI0003B7331A|nr:YkgJ family cysteine cluster protein [Desulfospira joergensenii]